MNFIVGRMIISDRFTSCDQYAPLVPRHGQNPRRWKNVAQGSLSSPSADGRLFHRAVVFTARPGCSGGGGLCSTAEDYYRFCQMMLNKGELNGVRLLSRKSVELMTQDHVQGKLDDMGSALASG
jgi:CubicO group peptidase (beta-lactamase class C family)